MDWDEALRLYRDEGWKISRIARAFDYSAMTVRTTLRAMGARRRRVSPLRRSARGQRLHGLWAEMRQRCRNPSHPSFLHYGGRGVTICDAWDDFEAFARWAIDHGYRVGLGLDLIDGATMFAPENCRLLSPNEVVAARARRFPPRTAQLLTAFGETKTITAWSKDPRCRVTRSMIVYRLQRKLAPEQAISEPHSSPIVIAHMDSRRRRTATLRAKVSAATLERLHCDENLTCSAIARRLGMTYSGVYERLRRLGIMRSTRTPASKDPEHQRLYRTWLTIRLSCEKPGFHAWRYVGARGIRVDDRWSSSKPFIDWAIRTGAAPGLCLVRIDRTKNYSPENCEWVTRSEATARARHHVGAKRPRVVVTAFGETKGVTSWSRDPRCNVCLSALLRRLRQGWDPALAVSTPGATPGGSSRTVLEAFGVEKSMGAWLRDRRCKMLSIDAIQRRIERGMSPEDAIRTPPYAEGAMRRLAGERAR